MKYILVLLLVVLCFITSYSQQYFRRSIDFGDSVNRRFVHDIEPLGALLLRGYLTGQIKAYSFNINGKDVKWKAVAPDEIPADWDAKKEYYGAERVVHKGKYYSVALDLAVVGSPPPSNEWIEYEPYREPVGTIWSFPGIQDTLRKADLLKNLIMEEGIPLADSWLPENMYFVDDIVNFNGKLYRCVNEHNPPKQPDLFTEFWIEAKATLLFHTPRDLNVVDIVYWRDAMGRLVPQTLSLSYMDMNIGIARNSGLNFYYPDVVGYLSRQQQLPLLYRSNLGYTGAPQLMLGWESSQFVLPLIHDNLSGMLKPSKNDILDAVKYGEFLAAKEEEVQSGGWFVIQELVTNDLTLFIRGFNDSGDINAPVVKIPWKSIEKLLKMKEPQPRTWGYLDGIDAGAFNSRFDTLVSVDSLDAKFQKSLEAPVASAKYFIDERSATIKDNPSMQKAMSSLWAVLKQALADKQVTLQPHYPAYFPCDQPFPEMSIKTDATTWNIGAGFSLEPTGSIEIDSAVTSYPVSRIGVQYKRMVTNQRSKTQLFEPVKVSLGFFHIEQGLYHNYYFSWEDIARFAATNPALNELVAAMKAGSLKFNSGECVYGLMGR